MIPKNKTVRKIMLTKDLKDALEFIETPEECFLFIASNLSLSKSELALEMGISLSDINRFVEGSIDNESYRGIVKKINNLFEQDFTVPLSFEDAKKLSFIGKIRQIKNRKLRNTILQEYYVNPSVAKFMFRTCRTYKDIELYRINKYKSLQKGSIANSEMLFYKRLFNS